ncbi:MAG: phosphomethylpyrimidine synthase ThiC [Pseudomonadota bacterium]
MSQLEAARAGRITAEVERAARREGLDPERLRSSVAEGRAVVPANPAHKRLDPLAVGEGTRMKVNANIGTSADRADVAEERAKLDAALAAGADAVMDLSTGGDIRAMRRMVIDSSPVPVGTVPIYEATTMAVAERGGIVGMIPDDLFALIELQAAEGVDFMTVHCGVTLASLERLRRERRVCDIVSRGGAFLTTWMLHHGRENPLYEDYDRLLEIARKHEVTLSLGDGLRPGCLADATDRAQVMELMILGELTERAWSHGVQVMIEGPGHVPLNQIQANVVLQKQLCHGAPFYVLGPLVTDIASGHDHIACAIGGALAGWAGADFLCYVTPAEHLSLPSPDDVREGVIAARIAAHAADIARGLPGSRDIDDQMARARKQLDWTRQIELSIDPENAARRRRGSQPKEGDVCTMCGEYCAIKTVREYFRGK